MLSKNKKKFILSLHQKKYRQQLQLFLAEGHKLNTDLLQANLPCKELLTTEHWLHANAPIYQSHQLEINTLKEQEIKTISLLKSPPSVIGIYAIPSHRLDLNQLKTTLTLALDEVQDPGNLGTILRIADWFGIRHIICSPNSADAYNPKVIQATMGAIARVAVHYIHLPDFITNYKSTTQNKVYGTSMTGTNIYQSTLSKAGLIVMGNEGKGISADVESLVSKQLHIPHHPTQTPASESLNVSMATAVICSEFHRQLFL
jgi:TrmH family RNA methyltransferase